MADVFISYCSADRARVGDIARALEAEGLSVWWDRALIPGERYEAEIDAALTGAKATLVVWSNASVASDWVKSEAEYARAQGKLTPVIIEACKVPRPFDRLHTADLRTWRGDRGNNGFPEMAEALKATVEGRAAKAVPWRRRLTMAAIGSAAVTAIVFAAAAANLFDTVGRWTGARAFAERSAENLAPDGASSDTQEGFREALAELARSTDLRTQRALSNLESGSRDEAIGALYTLAGDQGEAIEGQMRRSADLWRQIGLLRFNEDPPTALEALENARRYAPDDASILTPLGALYQRAGRLSDADAVYRVVLSQGALDPSTEGRLRQVIGQAHLDRSEDAAAESEFRRALTLAQDAVDDLLEADLSIDLGLVAMARGDFRAARAQFAEARSFASALDYSESVAYADFNTALAYLEEGDFAAADALLRSAKQAATTEHDEYLALFADLGFARSALLQGDASRALNIASAAQSKAAADGVSRATFEAMLQIAEAELVLGRHPQALVHADAARTGFQSLQSHDFAAIATALILVAQSHDGAESVQACRALASTATPTGYARREIQRMQRLSRC